MDVIIKCDPDFEGSDTLSCVFLENGKTEQNSVLGIETNTNIPQKVNDTDKEFYIPPEKIARGKELSLNAQKSLLLYHFKQFGCSQESLASFATTYSTNTQKALDYFKKAAKNAQDFVYQECDSLSFNNITEWLKYFQVMGIPKECNFEAAVILNGIANNECHPKPELMDGVDLEAVYRFISYALLGLPQEQLDPVSAKFLSNEFQNLINEGNTDEADIDVWNMKSKIEDSLDNNRDGKINSESISLDPLNIAAWSFKCVNK